MGGDPLAAFVEEHGQALVRLGWLLTHGDEAAAEDLVQTVLTTLVARGLDGLEHPLAYARRAMVNTFRDTARRQGSWRAVAPRLVDLHPAPDGAETATDRLALLEALAGLSERERTVVVLRFYEDLPDAEIARLLRCTRATVRSLARRALPKLRARLDPDGRTHPADPHPATEEAS